MWKEKAPKTGDLSPIKSLQQIIKSILLLCLMAVISQAQAQTTYYVSYAGNDASGTGSSENPWRSIQHAIDNVASNDVIKLIDDDNENTADFVENIVVNKTVTIESSDETGANPQVNGADGNAHVFTVTADNVIIKGLDIYGALGDDKCAILVQNSSGCSIQDNRCGWGEYWDYKYNYHGIQLRNSRSTLVYKNSCHNLFFGILVDAQSNYNEIKSNTCFSRAVLGIGIKLSDSDSNIVRQNDCTNGLSDTGIELENSDYNLVEGNDCSEHPNYVGLRLTGSSHNYIMNNEINDCQTCLEILNSSNSNNIVGNTCNGYNYAILITASSNNKIYFNSFSATQPVEITDDSQNIWQTPVMVSYGYNGVSYNNYVGNYYSGQTFIDSDGDGIADNIFNLPSGNQSDNYPLVAKIENYSVGELLPVELSSFTANVSGDKVILEWQTATETNNYGFKIERQARNHNWEEIGFITGHGTTAKPQRYRFEDEKQAMATEISYRLAQVDFDGSIEYSEIITVNQDLPKMCRLVQNYPNPFNPITTIQYVLPESQAVKLVIYDNLGQIVRVLANGVQEPGMHSVEWDGTNIQGQPAASGIYFYKLQAKNKVLQTRRMILLK